MDKNSVNIDDLFRQRLSGGEEKERAGAWANMSELLDKEMPAKRAVGMPWRRILTYTAGLVLLASMAFGGYEVISAHRTVTDAGTDIAGAEGNGTSIGKKSNTPNALPTSAHNTSVDAESAHTAATPSTLTAHVAVNANKTITTATSSNVIVNTTNATTNETAITTDHKLATTTNRSKQTKGIHHIIKNAATVPSSISATNTATSMVASGKPTSGTPAHKKHNVQTKNGLTASTSPASTSNIPNYGTSRSSIRPTSSSASTPLSTTANNETIASTKTITTKSKKAGHRNSNNPTVAAGAPTAISAHANNIDDKVAVDVAEKVKLDKIEVVEHYVSKTGGREGHYKNDTIDKSEVYDTRYVQTPGSSVTTAVASTTVPKGNVGQATATTASTGALKSPLYTSAAKTTGLTNSNATIATHSKKRSVTLANFADMVRDFRNNLGNATFAPGITGGINATFFSPNGITGFQIGVSGNVILNDNWSFMAELKYFTRFSGNAVINDNYVNYTPLGNGYYRRDSTQHFFKYNNLQSVELPIMVRYTSGKYNMFVGGNLAYDFAINNDFVDYHYAYQITNELSKNIKPQYSENDFVSRFGVGYVIGAGYNITPLLHADARIVQTLWDNSSTSGSQNISKDFYKHPSLQLSIGYTLKKKESKMP